MRELLGGAAVGLGKGRVAEANAWGVGRGAQRPTNMSAFRFKQTETAGAPCACAARAFGRGTGRVSRARTQAPVRAGLAGRGGAAMEVRTEVDLSLLLVGVLAGAQLCFLWALLSLRSGKFWQEKKALVITEIDTFDWVGGCFPSRRYKRVISAPPELGSSRALWSALLEPHHAESVYDLLGKITKHSAFPSLVCQGSLKMLTLEDRLDRS